MSIKQTHVKTFGIVAVMAVVIGLGGLVPGYGHEHEGMKQDCPKCQKMHEHNDGQPCAKCKKVALPIAPVAETAQSDVREAVNEGLMKKSVSFINAEGKQVGTATLQESPNGVIIRASLHNLTPGWHGFHIHETGACTAPDFKSAGGHYNPLGQSHGFEVPQGPHLGDMPNIYVGEDGKANVEVFAGHLSLRPGVATLLDADGSAIVVHAASDDYASQPSGDAGSREACAAITK